MMKVTYKSLAFLGYPKYRVGDNGSIWSYRSKDTPDRGRVWRWRRIKSCLANGYPYVRLFHNGKGKGFHVHILILLAFRGPCPKGCLARHFPDRTKTNCHLSNLSWASKSRNQRDRLAHGTDLRGSKHPLANYSPSDVEKMKRLRKTHKLRELAKIFGGSISAVSLAVNGKSYK